MMNPESTPSSNDQFVEAASSPVRVVTFDLDNTLWNTGATIGAANDVLAEFLNANNIVQSKRTEKIMGDLFQASKADYCPLAAEEELDSVKAPVLLTRLRKDALTQIFIQDNGYTEEDARKFADEAFDKVRWRSCSGLCQVAGFLLMLTNQWQMTMESIRIRQSTLPLS